MLMCRRRNFASARKNVIETQSNSRHYYLVVTLSKFDRCTKMYHLLDSDKYVSMGMLSKAYILRVLTCKLKERNY